MSIEALRKEHTLIAYGRSSEELARRIAGHLQLPVIDLNIGEYQDSETYVGPIQENVRYKDIVFVGSTPNLPNVKANDVIMDYVYAGDALIRSSARLFNFFVPYCPGLRNDRTKGLRQGLTSKRVISVITSVDPNQVIVVDPHEERTEGFFPDNKHGEFLWLTNLYAASISGAVKDLGINEKRVFMMAPDHGAKVRTTQLTSIIRNIYGVQANPYIGIADKDRINPELTTLLGITGADDLKNCLVIIPDDLIASGGTLVKPAAAVKEKGASAVLACPSHAVLTKNQSELPKILAELDKPNPVIDGLVLTNTLTIPDSIKNHPRVWVLDISEYAAFAIHNAWGLPHPDIENDGQGSLRNFNLGERESLKPQKMPSALWELLTVRLGN